MVDANRMTTGIVCDVVCVVIVATRFWCKRILKTGIRADDWWTLITVVSYTGLQAALLWGIVNGTRDGAIISDVADNIGAASSAERARMLQNFLKSIYVGNAVMFFVVYAIKMAILLLYKQIFSIPRYKMASNILMGVCTTWFVPAQVTALVHCLPVEVFWDPAHQDGKCLNYNLFFLIVGIIETIIDISILLLPIVVVFKTKMRLKTKFYASGIFLLGVFAIVTNILRVAFSYRPNTEFLDIREIEFWTNIHIVAAVLCACLPVFKPIRDYLSRLIMKPRKSDASSRRYSLSDAKRSSDHISSGFRMSSIITNIQTPQAQQSGEELLRTGRGVDDGFLIPVQSPSAAVIRPWHIQESQDYERI
jgi:hypothetical protein